MRQNVLLLIVFAICACNPALARVLDDKSYHLRSGSVAEWAEFEGKMPHGSRLDVSFQARKNSSESTLLIHQYNVKLEWPAEINGQKIGTLFLMEDPLVSAYRIPKGLLKNGDNVLSIVPPKENDDIVVHGLELLDGPPERAFEATLNVTVTEAGQPVPCRITIVNERDELAALHVATNQNAAARPGVVYTGAGRARIQVPSGPPAGYKVFASRGPEYSVATQVVFVAERAAADVHLAITREVPTPNLVSCDTHVHTYTHAKHGDATIRERMLTIAGEGLELPISTEHNFLAEFAEAAGAAGVKQYFTPVLGCEVTTKRGHFNAFPIAPDSRVPDFRIEHWPALMENIRATPGVRVVVLNHPRDVHTGFCPFAETNFNAKAGENLRGFEFSFDGVELINSGALRSDVMQVFHDWFALLNYGSKIVGVGASDSHDVSRFIVGQGRTYIVSDDKDPGRIDVDQAMTNLLQGKALISLGLITTMKVDERFGIGDLATGLGDEIKINAEVWGPSWATADRIEIFANGKRILDNAIPHVAHASKYSLSLTIPKKERDFHLIAIATGPGVRSPHWAIPRPYQASSPVWNPRILGATNPIWIDADGDGKFTPLRLQN
ncbi:MAG: CehA/McbA family metallohydrolase [Verrucomicrobia subdivision 3 bacterium]|nr:CehA/McbA family metallohydrolase [Limisphaerales bacterium]